MGTSNPDVDTFIDNLEHPRKTEIQELRSIILAANEEITERIKWNAPSFCYRGDDRVTMRLNPGGILQLVFHRGAKAPKSEEFEFVDTAELVKWVARDRGLVSFEHVDELRLQREKLETLVLRWMKATS